MQRTPSQAAPERLRSSEVAAILRITPRTVQGMAARGELPGAARIGKNWTFSAEKLRRFIAQRESECLTRAAAVREIMGRRKPTSALPSTESSVEEAYEDATRRLLGGRCVRPRKGRSV